MQNANKKLGYGVIGCRMGLAHMEGVSLEHRTRLLAACDPDEKMLAEAGRMYALGEGDLYNDYRGLIKRTDIDVVVVASPDQVHPEQTIAALEAGKHVLCEKPMAMTVKECTDMIEASKRTGKKLMIGQVCRYAPGFVAAKRLIEKGEIGELYYVESEYAHDYSLSPGIGNWRIDPVRLRHPVLGGGCHAVDLLRWIAGDPYEVSAYANRKVLKSWPVDDCTVSIMRFPNDVIGKVFVSVGCKRLYTMRSVFYGTEGTIIADNTSPSITVYKDRISSEQGQFEGVRDQTVGMAYPVAVNSHNVGEEIREFTDIILNNKPVVTDGAQGASTVAVCLAVVEAAAKGAPVKVNYDFK